MPLEGNAMMYMSSIGTVNCLLTKEICKSVKAPCDPNYIFGPQGEGVVGWLSRSTTGNYTVLFENDSLLATSPAQVVRIYVPLEADVDVYSIRLSSFGIGDTLLTVPANSMSHSAQFMHNGVLANLTAGVDILERRLYWVFESLDPQTLIPPTDPLRGVLPVNDTTGAGEGFVSFTMKTIPTVATRDTLSAQAEIIFDINEPILTNVWTNLLDAEGPNSQVDSLVSVNDSTLVVHYTAVDPNQGSGVERVDVYASENGGPMQAVVANLHPDSSYRFSGTPGVEYCFATVAHDSVYYAEELPVTPDQCITLIPQNFALVSPATGSGWCVGSSITITWGAGGISAFNLSFSSDSGQTFTPIANGVSGPTYTWNLPAWVQPGTGSVVRITNASDASEHVESGLFIIRPVPATPAITANGPTAFCAGGHVQLSGPAGFDSYTWQPTGPNSASNTVITAGSYSLAVTDQYGCASDQSTPVQIVVHQLPAAPTISPDPAEFCEGDSLLLTATGAAGDYTWSTGATTESIWVNSTSNVSVSVMDGNGCVSALESLSVLEWTPPGTPTIYLSGDTLCSDVVAQNYQWVWEGNPIWNDACVPLNWAGVYWLFVSNGPCQDSAVFIITDVATDITGDELVAIPNPNDGVFELLLPNDLGARATLQVTSSLGQVVQQREIKGRVRNSRMQVDVRDLASGFYNVLLIEDGRVRATRVTVRK